MFDGPKVALILLGILLPLVALGIYLVERRHNRGRRRGREPERLPLFGTDQLSIRTLHGYVEEDEAPVSPPPSRAVPRPLDARPAAPQPSAPAPRAADTPPAAPRPLRATPVAPA